LALAVPLARAAVYSAVAQLLVAKILIKTVGVIATLVLAGTVIAPAAELFRLDVDVRDAIQLFQQSDGMASNSVVVGEPCAGSGHAAGPQLHLERARYLAPNPGPASLGWTRFLLRSLRETIPTR